MQPTHFAHARARLCAAGLATPSGIKPTAPSKRLHQVCRASAGPDKEDPSTSGRAPEASHSSKKMPYLPIAALASVGAIETAYLTATKVLGSDVACPLSGGCASVLTSDYAMLWGKIPLPAAGLLAYGSMAAVAVTGARHAAASSSPECEASPFRTAVLAGSLLLATTSAYLMAILVTQFPGEVCPWCIGSAALSAGIVALAFSGMQRREMEDAVMPGTGLVTLTLLLLSLGLGNPNMSQAGSGITELEYQAPVVTTQSSSKAVAIARQLKEAGAKMYGAFWCSHCYEQKQAFGRDAMADFPYVECFPNGWKQGIEMAPVCKEPQLAGFPTWIIGNERYEGDQTLEQLEAALAKAAAPTQ